MVSKKDLAVTLSRLKRFDNPKFMEEQYTTDSEIASDIIWHAYMLKQLEGKEVADLGAGTGLLGIGCMLMGAGKVYFVEKDPEVLKLLKENLKFAESVLGEEIKKKYKIENKDISEFTKKVDMVIENPPFGTKVKHADKIFLEKAFSISNIIYSFHKTSTEDFIKAISKDHEFEIKQIFDFNYPLKRTMSHHKKEKQMIEVSCYYMEK
jgi:putative methylase